ncbi:MAG: SDR family NAD(P)-dependent oxidoreductase [Lachnospiraceae bacterium]
MMKKRVAIVTGGTRGIGRAISERLAKEGNSVIAVYYSDEESAVQTLAQLKGWEPSSSIIKADVSKQVDIDKVMDLVEEKYGRVDILVNNAGIFSFSFIEDMTEEYLDNIVAVNFKSTFLMMKAVIPYMKKGKYGRIVNASSISSSFADCGLVGYGASKASVDMLTKIGSAELGPYGITVNAYAPGITHTDMTDEMIKERGDMQVKQISLGRFGRVDEVAALVNFLSSEEGGYVTGEKIGVDGGMLKVQNPYRAFEYADSDQ